MSRSFVSAGRRLNFTAVNSFKAGDFAYINGFFGMIQDDVLVGRLGVLILDAGVNELKNVFGGNLAQGVRVHAAPTTTAAASAAATSLQIFPAISIPSGAIAVGRVWATGPASTATSTTRVNVFPNNPY